MSGFKALNIESDDESDIEIDDTKEIQIEDALKLYQTALKYHADGPASFDSAAHAYQELFASEIFKYPESQTELRRIELYGPLAESDDLLENVNGAAGIPATSLETGPSTLPQILHLSHKNYAQFKLESLAARFEQLSATLQDILADASAALEHFVSALDKDDTDLDLWRKAAHVGELLDSRRVTRYCLEAVLDGDDEGFNSLLTLPGLEDGLAVHQLKKVATLLNDDLSLLQPPLSIELRKRLPKFLRRELDPFGDLVDEVKALREQHRDLDGVGKVREVLLEAPKTWTELGDLILRQSKVEQHGIHTASSLATVRFDVPPEGPFAILATSSSVDSPHVAIDEDSTAITTTLSKEVPNANSEQIPGLDSGKSSVQSQIQNVERNTQMVLTSTEGHNTEEPDTRTVTLPSRKRSGDTAGLTDAAEEGRTKSRRIRARESIPDSGDSRQALIDANVQWEFEQQLNEFQAADDWMYETIGGLFDRIGVAYFEKVRGVKSEVVENSDTVTRIMNGSADVQSDFSVARREMYVFLQDFSDHMAQSFLAGEGDLNLRKGVRRSEGENNDKHVTHSSKQATSYTLISEHELYEFLVGENRKSVSLTDVSMDFVETMLFPGKFPGEVSQRTSYSLHLWPESLKTVVVRMLVTLDPSIHEQLFDAVQKHRVDTQSQTDTLRDEKALESFLALRHYLQNIFELHLDIYCLIKQPNSGVDPETVVKQGDWLLRWSELAREAAHLWSRAPRSRTEQELDLRFMWATTFHIAAMDDVSQEHVLECMESLRTEMVASDVKIVLQNNAIMPEVSVAALDREISKLTTKDFFVKLADLEHKDPTALIELIEPLLVAYDARSRQNPVDEESTGLLSAVSQDLVLFLKNSELPLVLELWERLRDAYVDIEYPPMVLRCLFRMIQMVFGELQSDALRRMDHTERQTMLMNVLKTLRGMTTDALDLMRKSEDALDCIDSDDLQAAVRTFGEIQHILQVYNVVEDPLRLGQTQPPSLPNGLPVPSFQSVGDAVHGMQLQIWMILYGLLKEAIKQNAELFPTALEDRFEFLRTIHRNFGIRGICGGLNRMFVRMLKDEFFQMTHVDGYDSEQAQVLYDLYGINCFLNPSYELIEHHCDHDAFLDRGVAMQTVDLLLIQADKLPIKELVKHSIKDTIDKVHGALARKKPTESILKNREIVRAFLRSAINPVDIFQSLKGEGNQLTVAPIPEGDALLASKGWHFLMGHIALTRFRSTKRTGPTPTEDVDIAIAFFMQDFEYSTNRWETWFRLAQAYDTKVEESVVWSAEKLNNSMLEVVQLQRAAIHCYTMATALAYRSADLAFETSDKMTELYTEFAMRLYSSSRAPFSMLPFVPEDSEKFLSLNTGMARGKAFQPLRVYTAWKLAKVLFQRAIVGNSQQWMLHYMLGKCLWKMHNANEDERGRDQPPTSQQVLDAFVRAIELLPGKKDTRDTKREPILEPHYKLVSVVHKMVIKGDITLDQAREALDNTDYARLNTFPDTTEAWIPHMLAVLKNLRAADKSNWHHRMIARAAQIIYTHGDPASQRKGASGAKHELTQQMFTKTMVLQVWRPDAERAGRHFVYTTRYTKFFVQILEELQDRSNLEMLARRARKRPHDLFEHALVWQDLCNAYLRLLRTHAQLKEGLETATFSTIPHEDFVARKEPLERWMQKEETGTNPALDVLREVHELKKVNANLMKPGSIDDLIGDAYAFLYNTAGVVVFNEERREQEEKTRQEEEARRAHEAAHPPKNPMMSLAHLMNIDGASDTSITATPLATTTATAVVTPQGTETAPAKRRMGVGRREIRNAAESCYQRSSNASGKNAIPPDNVRVQVVIQSSRNGGDVSADTSAPGSVHDDADDESELSELEEEGDGTEGEGEVEIKDEADAHHRPLFPGLAVERDGEESEGFHTADEGEAGGGGGGGSGGHEGDVDMKAADTDLGSSQPLTQENDGGQ